MYREVPELSDEGSILLIFYAKSVNIVAGSEKGSESYVILNSDAENAKNRGNDVVLKGNESIAAVKEFKLYNLGNAENYDAHVLNINVVGKGFKIYTFTFG